MQGFICVDISQTGNESLVHQEHLDSRFVLLQHSMEYCVCQVFGKRFRTQNTKNALRIFDQPDAAELACVIENQSRAIQELDDYPVMGLIQLLDARLHPDIPAHPQMDQQPVPGQTEL